MSDEVFTDMMEDDHEEPTPLPTKTTTATAHRFTKVSEWIAAGALKVGYVLESPVRETEKALGFKGVKFNSYGNPYDAIIWLPKSQLQKLDNDFYTNEAPDTMWYCPPWLYSKNPTIGERAA